MLSFGHCNFRFWKDFLQIKKNNNFPWERESKDDKKVKKFGVECNILIIYNTVDVASFLQNN